MHSNLTNSFLEEKKLVVCTYRKYWIPLIRWIWLIFQVKIAHSTSIHFHLDNYVLMQLWMSAKSHLLVLPVLLSAANPKPSSPAPHASGRPAPPTPCCLTLHKAQTQGQSRNSTRHSSFTTHPVHASILSSHKSPWSYLLTFVCQVIKVFQIFLKLLVGFL